MEGTLLTEYILRNKLISDLYNVLEINNLQDTGTKITRENILKIDIEGMKICFRIRDRSKSDQNSFKYKLSKLKQILSFFDLELKQENVVRKQINKNNFNIGYFNIKENNLFRWIIGIKN